ncbi:hypothetical protein CCL21_27600 [Pseudomonas syringae]|uniref:DUF4376 domain-containing protein n=1 Tax=Pseudomonas syringae TaxID=317 RepID=UPI000BB66A82|nr:hypothetical protein [Pseudomonas syringae]PBP63372.1 hypothetical protein CCL21_27600 [Pseudomonas syringae]
MRYAYFDPITREVIGWFDTEALDCILPDADMLVPLSQDAWEANANEPRWVDENHLLSSTMPVVPVNLDQVKASKLVEISSACAAAIVGGFMSSALGEPHTYPSQATDQSNLMAAVLSSLSAPAESWETPVWCVDAKGAGAYRMHTAAQVQAVGNDSLNARNVALTRKAALEERIRQAVIVEQVQSSSWPTT